MPFGRESQETDERTPPPLRSPLSRWRDLPRSAAVQLERVPCERATWRPDFRQRSGFPPLPTLRLPTLPPSPLPERREKRVPTTHPNVAPASRREEAAALRSDRMPLLLPRRRSAPQKHSRGSLERQPVVAYRAARHRRQLQPPTLPGKCHPSPTRRERDRFALQSASGSSRTAPHTLQPGPRAPKQFGRLRVAGTPCSHQARTATGALDCQIAQQVARYNPVPLGLEQIALPGLNSRSTEPKVSELSCLAVGRDRPTYDGEF